MSREHEIEDDHIGPLFARGPEGISARAGRRNSIAFFREVIRDERRDVGLVVHDEYAVRLGVLRTPGHESRSVTANG